jgi:hypothetical protein
LRRRHLEIRGVRVRFEQDWQRHLPSAAPQRIPTLDVVERMNDALEDDAGSYSCIAGEFLELWQGSEADPVSRLLEIFPELTARRLRLKTLTFNGRRLRTNSGQRRMMAWRMQEGSLYARLPSISVKKILSAPGLPIPYVEERHGSINANPCLSAKDIAYATATMEIDKLWGTLRDLQNFPPKLDVRGHTERLIDSCEKFSDLLFDVKTDLMWATSPASRLAYLRQEISDFLVEVLVWCKTHDIWHEGRRQLEKSRGRDRKSSIDLFIAEDLRPTYERIYNERCRITRREDEPPSGPFIAFALSFFEQVGFFRQDSRGKIIPYPSAETIAGALKPRRRRSS